MEQTTAKLRKTFRYPTDDEEEELLPEAMDEEEQENLIQYLRKENETRNKQYAQVLLVIPIICIFPYIPTLFSPRTSFLSLLSISSLLSTAYLVFLLPPDTMSISFLDSLFSAKKKSQPQSGAQHNVKVPEWQNQKGPVLSYLPYLNTGLCSLLGILGMISKDRYDVWWGFFWVPALNWGVVLTAKGVMASVDPEAELGGLKYDFKGV